MSETCGREVSGKSSLPIGHLFKQISDRLKQRADKDLQESGMTISQARLMGFLYERGGQASQKEIEQYLKVSHPTVTGIVARLEKSGFLHTFPDPKDRRSKMAEATDKARECMLAMQKGREEHERRLVGALSRRELEELKRLLEIVYRNLDG